MGCVDANILFIHRNGHDLAFMHFYGIQHFLTMSDSQGHGISRLYYLNDLLF